MRDQIKDLVEFYEIIDQLKTKVGGARKLKDCDGRMNWPSRGVYFFMEDGEVRADSGTGLRITRVGTHALKTNSKAKIWTRLSQHRGSARSGGGNHRGSIFRLIVGTALMKKENLDYPTWGDGSSAPREIREAEQTHERAISKVIGNMPFLWLAIEDAAEPNSLRGYIERNSIALLSNAKTETLDPPSENWLGHLCNRERVRQSGLWNQNHVSETYDPAFLAILRRLVDEMAVAP